MSRPIPMCHEMSQYKPTVVAVTAKTDDQMYQGKMPVCVADILVVTVEDEKGIRALSSMGHSLRASRMSFPVDTSREPPDVRRRVRRRFDSCVEWRVLNDELKNDERACGLEYARVGAR